MDGALFFGTSVVLVHLVCSTLAPAKNELETAAKVVLNRGVQGTGTFEARSAVCQDVDTCSYTAGTLGHALFEKARKKQLQLGGFPDMEVAGAPIVIWVSWACRRTRGCCVSFV